LPLPLGPTKATRDPGLRNYGFLPTCLFPAGIQSPWQPTAIARSSFSVATPQHPQESFRLVNTQPRRAPSALRAFVALRFAAAASMPPRFFHCKLCAFMLETARRFRGRGEGVRLATSIRPRENGRGPLGFANCDSVIAAEGRLQGL